ncbi:MAG: hypothetical protein EOO28_29930 [Comamonadaceae bacterium]|nr:MAG: hypothetical protein EOO28_29930 [Comamonadaceae bacterium]
MPETLAQKMAEPSALAYVTHPVKLPQMAINLFWNAKPPRSANQWLRELVFDLYSDAQPVSAIA